jgi:hypothetical protein
MAKGAELAAIPQPVEDGLERPYARRLSSQKDTWSFTPAAGDESAVTFAHQVTDGAASAATSAHLDIVPSVTSGTAGADELAPPVDCLKA